MATRLRVLRAAARRPKSVSGCCSPEVSEGLRLYGRIIIMDRTILLIRGVGGYLNPLTLNPLTLNPLNPLTLNPLNPLNPKPLGHLPLLDRGGLSCWLNGATAWTWWGVA